MVLKSIYLDADVLREAFPGVDRCTAVTVSTRHGTGRIARAAMKSCSIGLPRPTRRASCVSLECFRTRYRSAFGPCLKSQAPWSRDDHHREQIKEFALRKLRDPYLDTHVIAKGVGLSIRHLHKLLESEPDTLMRWIRAERLRRIKDELGDPVLDERPIAVIAYDWGFREAAHFSRAFRTAYGISPRIFRGSIQAHATAVIVPRAMDRNAGFSAGIHRRASARLRKFRRGGRTRQQASRAQRHAIAMERKMAGYQYCTVTDEGRVRIVTLNRPQVMNALHSDAHDELEVCVG